ncbi:MAG: cytochrome c [Bacteroidota bacterium]
MTNAQKWVAAFLGLFLILFILGRVTKEEETTPVMDENYMPQQQQSSSQEVDGAALIKQNGCTTCHGQDLNGTKMAPALVSIKEHWTRDGLLNYLRNPSAYSGDSRFDEYRQKYKGIVMPSYGNLDVKDLGKIAEYLLTK